MFSLRIATRKARKVSVTSSASTQLLTWHFYLLITTVVPLLSPSGSWFFSDL